MTKPLEGRTIVITRAASQAGELSALLENYGARVFACPTIEIREPDSYERLDEALDHLYGYDWLIFTSANAVRFFLQRLQNRGLSVADLDEIRVCAIGQKTADRLREAHVHVDVIPSQSTAEGVFTALSEFAGGNEGLAGLNFLLPRAAVGREHLPAALVKAGARVDVVTAYQTVLPENLDRGRLAAMLAGGVDCIVFTSPSTVNNLALIFDTHDLAGSLSGIAIACIGPVTSAAAVELGLQVDVEPQGATSTDLARSIAEYYRGRSA